jgi:phosphoribosyl 1,2-cyclic phosphate phosphodiesterase
VKTKITILGCGSSIGTPRIDGYWGKCQKIKKNYRTRCSALIQKGNNNILIDTSPDLKQQFLVNKVKYLNSVIYTHEHADQTHGINELRPFFWINKKRVNIYGNLKTINVLKKQFKYCFKKTTSGYPPILKPNIIKNNFSLGKKNELINFKTITVQHGKIKSLGYIFEKTAYLSDCNKIPNYSLKQLFGLKYLIIDCLRIRKHESHFNLSDTLRLARYIKPKKTILTNLHHDLDYNFLLNKVPSNVIPAFDGLKLTI